jgi:hypothetical protein
VPFVPVPPVPVPITAAPITAAPIISTRTGPRPGGDDRSGAVEVRGIDLRYALLVVLDCQQGLDRSIPELVEHLAALGVRPRSANPRKDVADALRWEVPSPDVAIRLVVWRRATSL